MVGKGLDLVDLRGLAREGVLTILRAWVSARGEVSGFLTALRESLPLPFGAAWVMPPYGCPQEVLAEVAAMSGFRERDMARRLMVVRFDGAGDASGYVFWFALDVVKMRRGVLEVYMVFQDPRSEVCYRSAMGGEAGP